MEDDFSFAGKPSHNYDVASMHLNMTATYCNAKQQQQRCVRVIWQQCESAHYSTPLVRNN
jgi:hypothetical protein